MMTEFFANSLVNGFFISSAMGKSIVLIQLCASVLMFTFVFAKAREFGALKRINRQILRDIMNGQNVLDFYLSRHDHRGTSPIENIYWPSCDRLFHLFSSDARAQLCARQPNTTAALTSHEMGLVKSICEHMLDEQSIRIEKGMSIIAMVVGLAPMLGLLGTVWGVLDAFADMGAAGSATLATMAPAISSALVTTVFGLMIAIPGVMMHTRLSSDLRGLLADMEGFADDLMGRIALEFQEQGRGL